MDYIDKLNRTISFLRESLPKPYPEIGIITGSGLGFLARHIEETQRIPYAEIPHFPTSKTDGHLSELVVGKAHGKKILMLCGRTHCYEGAAPRDVTLPIRALARLGLKTLIITNAAGGVNAGFRPGDIMVIADQINFTFQNALIGRNLHQWGVRFPDMSEPYDLGLQQIAVEAGVREGIPVKRGVYLGVSGPNFETRAEVSMIRTLGGDVVGMSTVHEVIVAVHSHFKVLGISFVSNVAGQSEASASSHEDVLGTVSVGEQQFARFILAVLKEL